ncbi:MAG: class I SAM-dependent methyltransferase [Lewinellaceae bacterium]|nr:class I SAM-dependent methyltransferase [Phaeodactylibacter sp.]MCB9035790.1 class I SAM-dependent methyltransferase [Lewinellaceae bacterium]
MFAESSEFYDLIYSFKDYAGEAAKIRQLLLSKSPGCQTILDVACGTGEHHKYLKNDFLVDGLDLNATFLEAARKKNPAGSYHPGDMMDFQLSKKYDVLLCLFSSIGYVKTLENVRSTIRCFARHLNPGGLILLEPWLTPENWYKGKLHMLTYDKENIKICRMNKSETRGNASHIHFHYLLATKKHGVRHFEEVHELGLFTEQEMKNAFEMAGLAVEHEPEGLIGRGLYIGRKK